MPTDILIAVDGTGEFSNKDYAVSFANSHCMKLHSEWHTTGKDYSRGPSLTGIETGALILWMTRTARELMGKFGADSRLFLCGYSRGGAAAIGAARNLGFTDDAVHHLILFDAVDRSPVPFLEKVTDNVLHVSHARRHPDAGSREIFGNCGTKVTAGTTYAEKFFNCTHGGVGGTPWTTAGKDGTIDEMSPGEVTAAKLTTSPLLWKKINETRDTNVTLAQDQLGAAASWAWMKGQVDEKKLLTGTS